MTKIEGRIKPEVARLWQRYYPDYDLRRFAKMVEAVANPESRVLEIGAGSGVGDQDHFGLKGRVAEYVGVDPDERVLNNPHLDRAIVAFAEKLPFDDESFNLVFHTLVAEHLPDPLAATREMARVLTPDGYLLVQTPSRWYYPMVVARLTPHSFHERYVARFGSGRKSSDVFPTHYRFNDARTIRRVMIEAGLVPDIQFWRVPPGYLRFHPLAFRLGVLYERTIEAIFPALRG
jgi:SAM-dependent methyltransferase